MFHRYTDSFRNRTKDEQRTTHIGLGCLYRLHSPRLCSWYLQHTSWPNSRKSSLAHTSRTRRYHFRGRPGTSQSCRQCLRTFLSWYWTRICRGMSNWRTHRWKGRSRSRRNHRSSAQVSHIFDSLKLGKLRRCMCSMSRLAKNFRCRNHKCHDLCCMYHRKALCRKCLPRS